jgi:calcineurin-like phosphoesterase family protein
MSACARRVLLGAVLLAGWAGAGATAAGAASVVVLPASPVAGTSALVSGSGFPAHRRLSLRLGTIHHAVRTDARGRFERALPVPRRWSGKRRRLTARAGRHRVRVPISIVRRERAPTSALAAQSGGVRFVIAATRAAVGSRVRVRGAGVRPRTRVVARVGGAAAGSARANRRRRVGLAMRVPRLPARPHTLTLRGRGVALRLRFTVLGGVVSFSPAPPAPPPPHPPPGPPPVVAAAGDIACSPTDGSFNGANGTATACRQAATAAAAAAVAPSAVLALGDTQYGSTTGGLAAYQAAYQASYGPSWGRFNGIVFPVPGDEEYDLGRAAYFGYFGARAGDPARGYYSFDLGSWHVIALNSNCARVSCSAGSAQAAWLRADLAAHPTPCTLAYWHQPRFSSGTASQATETQPFWDDLYAAGVDVVLGGHSHTYERFAAQTPDAAADPGTGIREFVVGTGGKDLQPWGSMIRPNSEVRRNDTFGVLALTLRPGGYDWRFVPVAGKTWTDGGSGACH